MLVSMKAPGTSQNKPSNVPMSKVKANWLQRLPQHVKGPYVGPLHTHVAYTTSLSTGHVVQHAAIHQAMPHPAASHEQVYTLAPQRSWPQIGHPDQHVLCPTVVRFVMIRLSSTMQTRTGSCNDQAIFDDANHYPAHAISKAGQPLLMLRIACQTVICLQTLVCTPAALSRAEQTYSSCCCVLAVVHVQLLNAAVVQYGSHREPRKRNPTTHHQTVLGICCFTTRL